MRSNVPTNIVLVNENYGLRKLIGFEMANPRAVRK